MYKLFIKRWLYYLQLENRDLEKKLQDAQRKIDELNKGNEALQARVNAVGIRERLTPSKRGMKCKCFFPLNLRLNVINIFFICFNQI